MKHEGVARKIDVDADVEGRDLGSVVADVKKALDEIDFPTEYHATMLGEYTERQAANKKLMTYGIFAAIGVFFLLQASFGSFRLAMLAFLTLPMALVGGALAARWTGGGIISLGSMVGFLTVIGIVARNGIMLVSHYQHLEREEGVPFGPDLVLQGAKERLVPIMMTVLTTGLALVPLIAAGLDPRSGDRAPDGRRHPGWPRGVDAHQPVRRPVAVPPLRTQPEGDRQRLSVPLTTRWWRPRRPWRRGPPPRHRACGPSSRPAPRAGWPR